MPKIIENLKESLLEEAKRQVLEQGYSNLTIRSVAKACGVGVGTVYNYFESKDVLVASFMLEDWLQCQARIKEGNKRAIEGNDAEAALRTIYDELLIYKDKYSALFSDNRAKAEFHNSFTRRHGLLTGQLAEPLLVWTEKQDRVDKEFLATYMAENILFMTMAGIDFEKIAGILLQLL